MSKKDAKINCSVFQKQEPAIAEITAKINGAKGVLEKADFAEELQKEVDVLLSCPNYNQGNTDCSNCRFIANVRKKRDCSKITECVARRPIVICGGSMAKRNFNV